MSNVNADNRSELEFLSQIVSRLWLWSTENMQVSMKL